tara:strand:- start:9538 stop:9708 length:171 start_codon:yes stop_codon:yes gene_type:complete
MQTKLKGTAQVHKIRHHYFVVTATPPLQSQGLKRIFWSSRYRLLASTEKLLALISQ